MDDQTKPAFTAQTLVAQSFGPPETVTNAVTPPIHMSSTFLRDPDNGYSTGYVYGQATTVQYSTRKAHRLVRGR